MTFVPPAPWYDRSILLGIGGGIAAYKACEVASTLAKGGASLRAILTPAAQQFVTPLTFSTLCRHPALTDQDFWNANQSRPLHIDLGEWAEVLVIAPLTANTLGKLVHGLADNLLTNTVLASTCPVLVAPAMNTEMWQQPAVQQNWRRLQTCDRFHTLSPAAGVLACDRVGLGRMVEPKTLLAYLQSLLQTQGRRDLRGKRILISAGSTQEYLDPVRFLSNPASGRMGIALAQAAYHRGATVTLIHGGVAPADLPLEPIDQVSITNAAQLRQTLLAAFPHQDWVMMAAAVADLRPRNYSPLKLPKAELPELLPLEFVPDIVAELAQLKQPGQTIVGFAAQTTEFLEENAPTEEALTAAILAPALEKLERKNLDAIVANPIDQPHSGFGSEFNRAVWLDRTGRQITIPPCTKLQMAHQILDLTARLET